MASCLKLVTTGFSVYYYFYESTKGIIIRTRSGSQALSTLESMLAGLIAGSRIPP